MDALGDIDELRALERELTKLLIAVRRSYAPAAAALGCSRLVDGLGVFRLKADQGTAYSVLAALSDCLSGQVADGVERS